MAAQFMALNHPAAAAQAALFSQGLGPAHFAAAAALTNPAVTSSPTSMLPRPDQQFMKGPGLTSLEALQR